MACSSTHSHVQLLVPLIGVALIDAISLPTSCRTRRSNLTSLSVALIEAISLGLHVALFDTISFRTDSLALLVTLVNAISLPLSGALIDAIPLPTSRSSTQISTV